VAGHCCGRCHRMLACYSGNLCKPLRCDRAARSLASPDASCLKQSVLVLDTKRVSTKLPSLLAIVEAASMTMLASGNRCSGVEMPPGARRATQCGGSVGLDTISSSSHFFNPTQPSAVVESSSSSALTPTSVLPQVRPRSPPATRAVGLRGRPGHGVLLEVRRTDRAETDMGPGSRRRWRASGVSRPIA